MIIARQSRSRFCSVKIKSPPPVDSSHPYCFCPDQSVAIPKLIFQGAKDSEGRYFYGCSKLGSGKHCSFFSLVERQPNPLGIRPTCFCSKSAILRSVHLSSEKTYRDYYTCGTNKHCGFFRWFDTLSLTNMGTQGAPNCDCGNPAVVKVANTTKNKGREYFVCASKSCDFFLWLDEDEKASENNVASNEARPPPPNEYALQPELSIRKQIEALQTSLNDPSLLANLPDGGKRMQLKLEKLLDALAYKKEYPDPVQPKFETGFHVGPVDCADAEPSKRIGNNFDRTNQNNTASTKLDLRVLQESLARKSNLKDFHLSAKLKAKLYPHQKICFNWMFERERDGKKDGDPRGGIVADDMGLGKTVQMIALMLSSLPSESDLKTSSSKTPIRSKATLIICPLAVVSQWSQEIECHTHPDSLRVRIHHGKNSLKTPEDSVDFDVVITTYQTVLSSFKENGVLHSVHWFRIVLDEAHIIKNHNTSTAKAIFNLESQTRWLMTATPLQNHLQDMFSVFKFLRYPPFCEEREWKKLFERRENGLQRLHPVLQGIMIRRTKEDKDENGNPLINLPPKRTQIYRLTFGEDEQKLYSQVRSHCQDMLNVDGNKLLPSILLLRQACNYIFPNGLGTSQSDGKDVHTKSSEPKIRYNRKKFASILDPLSTERQSEDNLSEALNKLSISAANEHEEEKETSVSERSHATDHKEVDDTLTSALNKLSIHSDKDPKSSEELQPEVLPAQICFSCSDPITDKLLLHNACHVLCATCSTAALDGTGICPVCGEKILVNAERERSSDSEVGLANVPDDGVILDHDKTDIQLQSQPECFRNSPKMNFLIRNLKKIKVKKEKAVVFSQWTTMLDFVEECLNAEGFRSVRIDGTMDRKDRQDSVHDFHSNPDINVFLLSLKCAGIGLNLTAANHCFMLDTWWNFAIEDQAFGRIYRIGQTRPVHIYRLIIQGTIEEKVLELQRHKQNLAKSLISSDGTKLEAPKISYDDLRTLLLE